MENRLDAKFDEDLSYSKYDYKNKEAVLAKYNYLVL